MIESLDFFCIERIPTNKGDDGTIAIKALLSAIIDQAIRDFLAFKNPKNKHKPTIIKYGEDAALWLFEEHTATLQEVFNYNSPAELKKDKFVSFENICEALDWDPNWIREKIRELVDEKQFYKQGRRRESSFEPGTDEIDFY
jgi:hypothetical protein